MQVTVHYERPGLERLLMPIVNWYEVKLRPGTHHDHIDSYGLIAEQVYNALGDFLVAATSNILDRNFDTICETKLNIPLTQDVLGNQYNEFLSTRVYPTFELIFRQHETSLRSAMSYLANHGIAVTDEHCFFYHHTATAGVFVMGGIDENAEWSEH